MIIEGQPYGVLVGTSIKRSEEGQPIIDESGFPLLNDQQKAIGFRHHQRSICAVQNGRHVNDDKIEGCGERPQKVRVFFVGEQPPGSHQVVSPWNEQWILVRWQ